MMLSVFHHHEHNQRNSQGQSSSENLLSVRPLSADRLGTSESSSNAHSELPITNSDSDHRTHDQTSSNGSSDAGQTNTSALPIPAGDVELQPQDLSLRPRRQENQVDPATNTSDELRCQFCNAALVDQVHLSRHMKETHGGDGVSHASSQIDAPSSAAHPSMGSCGNDTNGQIPNGASENESTIAVDADQRTNQSLHCPLCDAAMTDEAEFFEHFLRRHSNENGAESMNALFTPAASSSLKNEASTKSAGGGSTSEEDRNAAQKASSGVAYCELCNKEFCNKWFLKTHKAKLHGVTDEDTEDLSMGRAAHQSNNGGGQHSRDHTPKLSPVSSVFDPTSGVGNPLSAIPLGTLEQQQQLAALAQQQNVCPFCHMFFPNVIILQSHLLTSHSGLLMNPTAAVYAASIMSANPFASGNAFFQQPQQANGKNNLQQQQQHMAAIAAMLGFGAAPASDPMAAMGSALDYFGQGVQQTPSIMMQGLNTSGSSTAGALSGTKGAKFTGQQQYQGLMGILDEDKPTLPIQQTPTKNMEAYCEICQKEFCNKYFLRTHKMNKHGILEESPRSSGGMGNSRVNVDNSNKSPGTNSPVHYLPSSSGKDLVNGLKRESTTFADLLRGAGGSMDEEAPPASKLAKLMDEGGSYAISTTTAGQFPCNLCVKAFPSMFALVAHKYRDHGTFDGATASALVNQNAANAGQQASSSPNLGFGQQRQQRKSLESEPATLSSPIKGVPSTQSVDLEAYCEICQKEFCSKYFLRVHKANIHGIGTVTPNSSPSMVVSNGSGVQVPAGVRRSLNGSVSNMDLNGSHVPMNLISTAFKQEKESGRRSSTNGTPSSAAAILMMAASGGIQPGVGIGRPLVASKNFCDICNKELCNKYFLRTHMLKMHGIVIDENKTVIANINTLDKEKNGELLFRCDLCGEQLASRQQLRAHKQSVHQIVVPPSTIHSSSVNAANDNSISGLQDSQSSPPNSIKRESTEDFVGTLAAASGNGMKDENQENDKSKGLDFSYMQTTPSCSGECREVLCTICGKKYKNARCLRVHILSDHAGIGQKAVTKKAGPACEYCSMEFPDHAELQLHVINEHQREVRGSVACMAEQAALDALSNSSAFVAAVNSVANAVAEVAATAGSSRPSESMKNEVEAKSTPVQQQHTELPLVTRAKNGTKLFRCSYCNYYTRWISNLSTHEKRHNVGKPVDAESGEKPFKCRMCLRSYRYSHSLQRHMEVHRSSAIGLRTMAASRAPIPLPTSSVLPAPAASYSANDVGSKTPPALTPGPNGHDHAFSGAFSLSALPPALDGPQEARPQGNGTPEPEPKPNSVATPSPDRRHHCQLCGKAFGNRELYRMHVLTIHNVAISPDSSSSNVNVSPKRSYRCRMCHFVSSKSYDDLRMHMFQKHSTTPAYLKALSSSKGTFEQNGDGQKKNESGLDLTSKHGQAAEKIEVAASVANSVIQAFLMREKSETGVFPTSSVVYLPVQRRLESPIEATFTFTPISGDQEIADNAHV